MFPWQGEGKSAWMPPKAAAAANTAAAPTKSQQQQPQQPQPQQHDSGYGRWRLSSVLQRNQAHKVNNNNSIPSTTIDNSNAVSATSDIPATNTVTSTSPDASDNINANAAGAAEEQAESMVVSADDDGDDDGDDDNEDGEEEDGEGDEEGNDDGEESDGEDIDFRSKDGGASANASSTMNNTTTTNEMEQQDQQQHGIIGDSDSQFNRNYNSNNNNRRLNTEEEIKLFEICNKHSATFGERSKLCEWWKTVADEFVRSYSGPYSWHSVRRKVDIVTRQRIKYLAEVKDGNIMNDQATEEWRKVLDEWIPTWEKFENAEKRRIEVRDAKAASRKRKEGPLSALTGGGGDGGSTPKRPAAGSPASAIPWQATPQKWAPYPPHGPVNGPYGGPFAHPPPMYHQAGPMGPPPPPPHLMSPHPPPQAPGTKLPEGYDTMFRGSPMYPPQHMGYYPPPVQYPPTPSPAGAVSAPQTPSQSQGEGPSQQSTNNTPSFDGNLTSAVIETLTKLNKHLDKADASSSSLSSPLIALLTGGANNDDKENNDENNNDNSQDKTENENEDADADTNEKTATPEIANKPIASTTTTAKMAEALLKLKNELKQEIRAEFESELSKVRAAFTSKFEALEQTQEMIMDMLRQEPGRESSSS